MLDLFEFLFIYHEHVFGNFEILIVKSIQTLKENAGG